METRHAVKMAWRDSVGALKVGVWAATLAVLSGAAQVHAAARVPDGTLAPPPGIRIKTTFVGAPKKAVRTGEVSPAGAAGPDKTPPRRVFADASNLPLYVYAKDPPGQSTCTGACATLWKRALAPSGAKPLGEWSLIKLKGGGAQWAFRRQALYVYANDHGLVLSPVNEISGLRNISPDDRANGDGLEEGAWHAVVVAPDPGFWMPPGLSVSEVGAAPGQAIVDETGGTLYVFQGKGAVSPDWIPVAAPMGAVKKFGEFTVLTRPDGVFQWAIDGKPLYRYRRDYVAGDANGSSADARFRVALLMRYFMPPGIAIRQDEVRGGVLMIESDRKTLYAQDFLYVDNAGGQNIRGKRGAPAAGEEMGAAGCVDECLQSWHPLKAPDDAKPRGDWTVFARPDGSKQWGYQGFALYTYAGDGPDQVNGVDIYYISMPQSPNEKAVGKNFGFYWRAASVAAWKTTEY